MSPCILIVTRNCVSYVPESRDRSTDTSKLVISEMVTSFYISVTIGLAHIACYIIWGKAISANVEPATRRKNGVDSWRFLEFLRGFLLASHLWKNEMRRISVPSTSISGRKFTEVTAGLSLRPVSASPDLFHCA